MIASYIGENKTFEKMYLTGEIELELTPQGTLAERCASGGKGIPAFYTPAAFGTVVQTGELPLRNNKDGTPAVYSYPKDVKVFDGKQYLLEEAIKGDYAFVKAWKADKLGNCQFRLTANNFNGAMGRNAKMTIVEAEEIVEPGEIAPEAVHLPGIYVKRVIQSTTPKSIEKYTFAKDENEDPKAALGSGETAAKRERIVRRAAKEFKNGMYANLGIGMFEFVPLKLVNLSKKCRYAHASTWLCRPRSRSPTPKRERHTGTWSLPRERKRRCRFNQRWQRDRHPETRSSSFWQ